MTRWKLGLVGLALTVAAAFGCKQRLYISEPDHAHYQEMARTFGGPLDLENDPSATIQANVRNLPKPPTVDDPNREVRELTLAEAIAIALEQGNVGSQSALFPGIANDNIQASPRGGTFSDSIRVLALDPAIAGADIEASLSKFDARFLGSMTWNKNDNAIVNTFSTTSDTGTLNFGYYKPLPTGGVAGITFNTDYQKLDVNNAAQNFFTLNSFYRPRLQFQFEHPILQNYGIEINQLNASHPGATQIQRFRPPGGGRVEGVLITRLRFEASKAEFERNVNFMLLNVEYSYWNLYAAYGTLFSRNESLVEALRLWRVVKDRVDQGLDEKHEEARARAQVEGFRAARLTALGDVIEKERQLRGLLGLPYDGTRLVPKDDPALAPYAPDWQSALNEAMTNRPELTLARQDLKFRQFDLMVQKNQLKPDLRFIASYDINGIGRRLDGSEFDIVAGRDPLTGQVIPVNSPRNALASLANNRFNTWTLGFLLDVPIGFRDAHSAVRVARLNMIRSYASMRDSERKIEEQVRVYYARLSEYQQTVQYQRAQYKASAEQYKFLEDLKETKPNLTVSLEAMLNAQRTKAEARIAEFRAIADYNNTLAGFQFAKGTIMNYDSVMIADGPLPQAAQIRAVDHIRERTKAPVIRERAGEQHAPPGAFSLDMDPAVGVLPPSYEAAPNVPAMIRTASQQQQNSAPARIPSMPAADLPSFGAPVPQRSPVSPYGASTNMPR